MKPLLISLCLLLLSAPSWTAEQDSAPLLQPAGYVRTVDGDTLVVLLDGAETHVRLFGVDSPEISFGKAESSGFLAAYVLARTLEEADTLYLERDPVDLTDRFDRVLAWLWVEEGGRRTLLNTELLRLGLAKRYPRCASHLYDAELDAAEAAHD